MQDVHYDLLERPDLKANGGLRTFVTQSETKSSYINVRDRWRFCCSINGTVSSTHPLQPINNGKTPAMSCISKCRLHWEYHKTHLTQLSCKTISQLVNMSLENKRVLIWRHEILKIFFKANKIVTKLNNGVI